MAAKHAFEFLGALWFLAWAIIGYLDPTVSVLFGIGVGAGLAVSVAVTLYTFDRLWDL